MTAAMEILPDSHVEGFIAACEALIRTERHCAYVRAVERATAMGHRWILADVFRDVAEAFEVKR